MGLGHGAPSLPAGGQDFSIPPVGRGGAGRSHPQPDRRCAGVAYLKLLRGALTKSVNELFAEAGDAGLEQLGQPLELSGAAEQDVAILQKRLDAQSGLVRAIAFQREVDALGSRTLSGVMIKATPALGATIKRLATMSVGSPK